MQSVSYDDVVHSLKQARDALNTLAGNCGQKLMSIIDTVLTLHRWEKLAIFLIN